MQLLPPRHFLSLAFFPLKVFCDKHAGETQFRNGFQCRLMQHLRSLLCLDNIACVVAAK